ncbi:MAG: peptidylprolyl isomerase, partial [Acetivibrio ethanolgignens]
HQLSDLFDDASVAELVKQIREKQMSMDTITNYEIQQYYDSNRDKYGDKAFSDVKEEIREILYAQKEEEYLPAYIEQLKEEAGLEINYELLEKTDQYEIYKNEALFDVHGKKYTLGDFMTEFNELSEEYQQAFEGYENKKILVDQLAVKELILEDGGDDATDGELNHDTEELKISYLYQIMHQEEIDEKIAEPTEEEIAEYYETYKSSFMIPESAKVKVIWIEETGDGKGKDKADKAAEALKNGSDFAEIAKQYSEDGSAETGGEVEGDLYRNHLDAGEISDATLVHGGYYIFQLVSKQEEEQMALEEVREDIISHISDERHHELEKEMEDMLLEQSNLIIYEKTLLYMLNDVDDCNGTEK